MKDRPHAKPTFGFGLKVANGVRLDHRKLGVDSDEIIGYIFLNYQTDVAINGQQ